MKAATPFVGVTAINLSSPPSGVENGFSPSPVPADMSLDDLEADVESTYTDIDEDLDVTLDEETKRELTMLVAALDPEEPEDLVRRAVHLLFQSTVETGKLDFHLRSTYDVTYDEYLSGMTFDEMTGNDFPQDQQKDDRRYQF